MSDQKLDPWEELLHRQSVRFRQMAEESARLWGSIPPPKFGEPQVNVIKPGSLVTLTNGIEGIVLVVQVGNGNVISYQCAWWVNGTRSVDWFSEPEVQLQSGSNQQIGFVK